MKNDGKDAKNASSGNHPSSDSHSSQDAERIIPPRGDYQTLHSFHKAEVVYDLTFRFAHKIPLQGRPHGGPDDPVRPLRKKEHPGGQQGRVSSKETEIKLTNVARASLEELLDDYKDYLRARDLPLWPKDSREAQYVRQLGRKIPQTYELYRELWKHARRKSSPTLPSA